MDSHPYLTDPIKAHLFDLYDRLDAMEEMQSREYRMLVLAHWYVMLTLVKFETVVRQALLDHEPLRRWLPMFENSMLACRYAFRRFPISESRQLHPFRPNEGRLVLACFHALLMNGPWLTQVLERTANTRFGQQMQRCLGYVRDAEASRTNAYPTAFYRRSDPPPYRRRDLSITSSNRNNLLYRLPCVLTELVVDGFDSMARVLNHRTIRPEERLMFARTYATTNGFGNERVFRAYNMANNVYRNLAFVYGAMRGHETLPRELLEQMRQYRPFQSAERVLHAFFQSPSDFSNRQETRLMYAVLTTFVLDTRWVRQMFDAWGQPNTIRSLVFQRDQLLPGYLNRPSYDSRVDMVLGRGLMARIPPVVRSVRFLNREPIPNLRPPQIRVENITPRTTNETTWMNRVPNRPIPEDVANENRRNLYFDRLDRGIRLECGHWVSKADFSRLARGLVDPRDGSARPRRLAPTCPQCRAPIRKDFFVPEPRPRIRSLS